MVKTAFPLLHHIGIAQIRAEDRDGTLVGTGRAGVATPIHHVHRVRHVDRPGHLLLRPSHQLNTPTCGHCYENCPSNNCSMRGPAN